MPGPPSVPKPVSGDSVALEKDRLLKEDPEKYGSNSSWSTDDKEDTKDGKQDANGTTLLVAFLAMLFFQLGNRIFGRLLTYPMHPYPMFMNILSVFIYIPISFAYIAPVQLFTKIITKEQTDIPKHKFCVMGLYDSVAGIMQVFATNYITNSSTIVLVQQSAIPISMLISKLALNAKYTIAQYVGAVIVLLGIVVVMLPTFFGGGDVGAVTGSSEGGLYELLWIAVMVVSCVPMCMSSVYKEKALGEMDIDVVYLNGWVAIFQFLFAIPLCIPSALVIDIPIDGIMDNMYGGLKCYAGINTSPHDNCALSPLFVTLYLFFNVGYNILMIVILKIGSANILWMASTVGVPLSNVAFSLKFMPGHKPLKAVDIVGLFVIMAGLILYRFWNAIESLGKRFMGYVRLEDSDPETEKKAIMLGKIAESRQTRFVGINQIESLQSIIDHRVHAAQKKGLFRTPQQIRSQLLVKLGIPPSPLVQMTPNGIHERVGIVQDNGTPVYRRPSPLVSGHRVSSHSTRGSNSPIITIQSRQPGRSASSQGVGLSPAVQRESALLRSAGRDREGVRERGLISGSEAESKDGRRRPAEV
jgi:uncharacterized membrane protein